MKRFVRSVVVGTAALVVVVAGSSPASAKGSHLTPVRDRYEPGELATLVGYTGGPQLQAHRPSGPFRAFLEDAEGRLRVDVGQLELTDTGRRGWEALRVVARFVIPVDLPPGHYRLTYCTDTCRLPLLGDVTGGIVSVGTDPPFRWSHLWPLDEPEIANLPDHAILTGPGYQTTAGDVRAGRIPVMPTGPPGAAASVATEPPAATVTGAAPAPAPAAETLPRPAAPSLRHLPEEASSDDPPWGSWTGAGAVALVAVLASAVFHARRPYRGRCRNAEAIS